MLGTPFSFRPFCFAKFTQKMGTAGKERMSFIPSTIEKDKFARAAFHAIRALTLRRHAAVLPKSRWHGASMFGERKGAAVYPKSAIAQRTIGNGKKMAERSANDSPSLEQAGQLFQPGNLVGGLHVFWHLFLPRVEPAAVQAGVVSAQNVGTEGIPDDQHLLGR